MMFKLSLLFMGKGNAIGTWYNDNLLIGGSETGG